MLNELLTALRAELSGDRALDRVAALSRFHRIQASSGLRAAVEYCAGAVEAAGLKPVLHSYVADGAASYWGCVVPQEWDAQRAVLELVRPAAHAARLADFEESPISLVQRSAPTAPVHAGLVVLDDGEQEAEYRTLDLRRKLVLTRGDANRVRRLAVDRHGALGLLCDGLHEIPDVRTRLDLADARQYTSFWWSPKARPCFGFVLTPRQGESLRRLARTGPVGLQAEVRSQFRDGRLEVLTWTIPGETDDEILLLAHICHPQPSANDNASGVAVVLEVARVLARLFRAGSAKPPLRTIRFLLVPEMSGTIAYLATRERELGRLRAALNLDMVGEDQERCQSSLLIERPPLCQPSYAPALLEAIRDRLVTERSMPSGAPGFASFRWATVPYSGGSDHYVLADPTVGIPCPMVIQWPDRFYHTSLDTPDKTDPRMLARVGLLAATYVAFLARADEDHARWLGLEVLARARRRMVADVQAQVTAGLEGSSRGALHAERIFQHRLLADRQSLARLADLGLGARTIERFQQELDRAARAERARLHAELKTREERHPASRWEERASRFVPRRLLRGPIPFWEPYVDRLTPADQDELFTLRRSLPERFSMLADLALFWADGKRSLAQIADRIEAETGRRETEFLVRYVTLLRKMKVVEAVAG